MKRKTNKEEEEKSIYKELRRTTPWCALFDNNITSIKETV